MQKRYALLVGSMPFENEEEAMTRALKTLSGYIHALPDGEIGEKSEAYPKGKRAAWVQAAMDLCVADSANWDLVKRAVRKKETGFPEDYDQGDKVRPKHSPAEMEKHLNFRYHEYFESSYPIFKRLREQYNLPNLKFQVGVPTGLGIAFGMMSPPMAFRYSGAFNRRLAYEMNEIIKKAGDDVVIQVEVPPEVALAYRMPKPLVRIPLNSMFGLVKLLDPSAKIGVHLCLGDLNNKALTKAATLDKMVFFTNKMIEKWPKTHNLSYIHLPFAEGDVPPPLEASYYEPLKAIQLPQGVGFVAGFVHEKRSLEEHKQILEAIEKVRGQPVDVACSCGMGRRSTDVGAQLLELTKQVVGL